MPGADLPEAGFGALPAFLATAGDDVFPTGFAAGGGGVFLPELTEVGGDAGPAAAGGVAFPAALDDAPDSRLVAGAATDRWSHPAEQLPHAGQRTARHRAQSSL